MTPDKIKRFPHLLIYGVIAFSFGIILSSSTFPGPALYFIILSLATAVYICWKSESNIAFPALFLFLTACGLSHGNSSIRPPTDSDSLYQHFPATREATLTGTLLESPVVTPEKTKLTLAASAVYIPENDGAEPADSNNSLLQEGKYENNTLFQPASGKIELTVRGNVPEIIRPGEKLLIRATVSRPGRFQAPGSFDYPQYLAHSKSVWVTGWVRSPAHIHKLSTADSLSLAEKCVFLPEQIRQHINVFIDTHLAPPENGLYKAILTGDRSSIHPEIYENFKASGTVHLLAISGLHMGLIALAAGFLINWLLRRSARLMLTIPTWKAAAVLAVPFLIAYAAIAGFQTPVVRSLIMTLVFLVAVTFDRQWHMPSNIATAAAIILILQPEALFTASFQLSFAAIISMAAVLPRIRTLFFTQEQSAPDRNNMAHILAGYVKSAACLSIAAQIGTLPLLLYYFNRFSTLSAVSTVVIEPFLCLWALPMGLIGSCCIQIAPHLADFFFQAGNLGLTTSVTLAQWFARLPFSTVWLPTPSVFMIILYYVALVSFLHMKQKRIAQWTTILGASCLLCLLLVVRFNNAASTADRITFLDVGQGNATVIELADGFKALIDGGGPHSDRFNVGEAVIAPYLWHRGIRRIDTIIITHPDSDHFNGLPFIIKRFKPKTLWINGDKSENFSYREILETAREFDIQIKTPNTGETLYSNSFSRLTNLTPAHFGEVLSSDNDRSLVLKLSSQGKNLLFTGDISTRAEEKLIATEQNLQADILLIAHHGSISSSCEKFLQAVDPQLAVISAGRNRKNIFPAQEILRRCRENGIIPYNTSSDGTITVTVQEGKIELSSFIRQ